MNLPDFADLSIFLPPLLTGLGYALLLPVLGCYLRLRDETLAALAYAQVGASGALGAMVIGLPLTSGGIGASVLAALIKPFAGHTEQHRKSLYAVMLVLAWAVGVLMTSNFPLAERLGHALFDGQLLLNGSECPWLTLSLALPATGLLLKGGKHLLLARIFPDTWHLHVQLSGNHPARWLHRGFDLLAAISIAMATMTLGVMACFALLLIPAWCVFTQAPNWQSACRSAMGHALLAYGLAFMVSLVLDQPFGPVLVLCLALLAAGHPLRRLLTDQRP